MWGTIDPTVSWIGAGGRGDRPRPVDLAQRLAAAQERPGGAAGEPFPHQDRPDRRRRDRRRGHLQHQPRQPRDARGRALGHPDRPRRARGVDHPAAAHEVRSLRLRDRRQRRGGAPGRHQRLAHPHRGLRPLLVHGRRGDAAVRVAPGRHVEQRRGRAVRPVCGRRGGHRRHQPVRGRGKPLHGVLGGLVIAGIYNGLYLLPQLSSVEWQYIITGLVLLAAVVIDAVSRRGASSGSVTRA